MTQSGYILSNLPFKMVRYNRPDFGMNPTLFFVETKDRLCEKYGESAFFRREDRIRLGCLKRSKAHHRILKIQDIFIRKSEPKETFDRLWTKGWNPSKEFS